MKKIIRWFADISGVTEQITIEANKRCGHEMRQNAYWWNGGIMHKEQKIDVMNAFNLYSSHLIAGWHCPIGNGMMELREKVYNTKEALEI